MVAISALERTGWMPSSCSAMSSIVWWVRTASRGSTESKSLWGDVAAIRVGSAGWRVPGAPRHLHQVRAEVVDEGTEGQATGPGGAEVGHSHARVSSRAGLAPAQQLFIDSSRGCWGGRDRGHPPVHLLPQHPCFNREGIPWEQPETPPVPAQPSQQVSISMLKHLSIFHGSASIQAAGAQPPPQKAAGGLCPHVGHKQRG